ncbi:histidine phosphatase family protein [Marivirga arenosa]|uniref:Histidine phosphatase family protein n=1 Tax=Marivirga arenosa TaxID=3059076 RepID=A0AA49GG27_9BACT|nr:histidine phosphatase family protein [Marivirga sp. ABR2-2]WKK85914.2 histidine phosphatase family protein [Marivirga sp. ABR2-2]
MRNLIAIIFLAFFITACSNSNDGKVIYLVRHAEKDTVPKNDPALTTDGVIRSVDLASWFKDIQVDSIFSTDFVRTKETVKPIAEDQNKKIAIYDAKDLEAFASQLKEMKVDTILISGHSNTILEQIEALGIERPQEKISENEYDKLFEVRLGEKKVITHTYGSKYKE